MILERSHIENLELIAKQVVEGFIIGLHKSPFHGFSVEFAEHRLYNNGDPLRHIDWRVYGRTDKLFVKKYEEETNLRCCIAIDTSSSMLFPTDRTSKLQFAIVGAASLLHLLKKQLDAAALAMFDEDIIYFSAARSSASHYKLLLHQLENTLADESSRQKGTNAAKALHAIADQMHKRSLIVVFSDMMDDADHVDEVFSALQHLKFNKHEVILFHTLDKEQEQLFDFDNRPFEFVDMETGDRVKLQPQQAKDEYVNSISAFRSSIEEKCHQYKIDYVPVDLQEPIEKVLHAFLLKRNKLQ